MKELERTLNELLKQSKIYKENPPYGIIRITGVLYGNKIISLEEKELIMEIIRALNSVVHGNLDGYKIEDIDFVFTTGLDILNSLNNKLQQN